MSTDERRHPIDDHVVQPRTTRAGDDADKARKRAVEGMTPVDILKRLVKHSAPRTLAKEFDFIHMQRPSFDAFMDPVNHAKNRYHNLILYDHTRIVLDDTHTATHGDYVHASYVDGYDKAHEYILGQAPHTALTEFNFWRLVCQETPSCVVLVTALTDPKTSTQLATDFWATTKGDDKTYEDGAMRVHTDDSHLGGDCDFYELTVGGKDVTPHAVRLLHFRQWESDDAVPAALLQFQAKTRLCATQMATKGGDHDAPMLIACSTGVHRAGTFAALDIVVQRIQHDGRVALEETVKQLRRERYGVVQLIDHYLYITEAIVEYAIQTNCVHADDVPADAKQFNLRGANK